MTQEAPSVNLNCERLFAHIEGHTEFDYILGEK